MKSDKNGCSTCQNGQESFEQFYSPTLKRHLVQYDYRTGDGKLFSTVAPSIEVAINRRNKWLKETV
jgi:hypothetical protein